MAFEIELKAWVDDIEAVRQRLEQCAAFAFQYEKEDWYWRPRAGVVMALPVSGVRLRRETRSTLTGQVISTSLLVTYKTNEQRSTVELNTEHEFSVTGTTAEEAFAALTGLFRLTGLETAYFKKKTGVSYRADEITAELSEVEHLGMFIELEILANSDEAVVVEAARRKLFALLAAAGVDDEKIEMKYYSELLKERGFA